MREIEASSKSVRVLLSLLATIGAGILFFLPASANAATEPFEIQFDKSNVQIGAMADLPLDTIASGSSLKGTIDETGKVTIPKGSFTLPELGLDDPIKVRGFMGIEGPATGTYDAATGRLELDAKAGIWLNVDVAALADLAGVDIGSLIGGGSGGGGFDIGSLIKPFLSNLTCGFSPMDVHFTTESTSISNGTRFTKGTAGTGAITAEWSQLGPFSGRTKIPILGLDPCQMILDYLPGLLQGGLGGTLPGGIDLGGLDLTSILANLNNVNLGASAITLTRTVDEHVGPGPDPDPDPDPQGGAKLKLWASPRDRQVKAGRTVAFKVKVRNVGGSTADKARVCLSGPGIGLLVRWRCRSFGSIKPGQTKTGQLKVRARGKARRWKARIRFQLKSSNAAPRTRATKLLIR